MSIKRSAQAVWNGTGKEGKGSLSTQSGILNETPYNYISRFEQGTETNPEELIGAAHAACFSMKLAFVLNAAGFVPDAIKTKAEVILDKGTITDVYLVTEATVPGITEELFNTCAQDAKLNCPVSKLLNANIHLTSSLC